MSLQDQDSPSSSFKNSQKHKQLKSPTSKTEQQIQVALFPGKLNSNSNNTIQKHSIQENNQNINNDIKQENMAQPQIDEQEDQAIWKKVDEIIKRIKFKKYLIKFLSLSEKRMLRLMTLNQHKMIFDRCSFYEANKHSKINPFNKSFYKQQASFNKNNLDKQVTEKLSPISLLCNKINSVLTKWKKLLSKFPVFSPNIQMLNIWQGIKMLSILTCFFCYLICFAFGYQLKSIFNYYGILICQFVLGIDILVTLNTGIYLRGVLTVTRIDIFNAYKQHSLVTDIGQFILSMLYYILSSQMEYYSRWDISLLLPILWKHTDINQVFNKIKDKFLLDKKKQNIIELFSLLKNILLISHVFACIWIYVAKISNDMSFQEYLISDGIEGNHTWITLMNLQSEKWLIQYLYSYYFITVTMITVGYGDIRPVNPVEVIVCTVLMMVCCVIFGFTINSIGEIFQDFFREEKIIRQKRCVIGNYMKRKDINSKTKKSIYEYLDYYWKQQIDESLEEERKIVGQLSDNLKEQLFLESNKIILKQAKIFRENFSPDLVKKCLPIIQEQNCTPGEVLIDSASGNTDCYIFFVQQGELEATHHSHHSHLFEDNEKHIIKKIKKGECFGEKSFFTGETKSMTIRSVNFSILLRIKREDFLTLVRPFQNEYETFCMMKDRGIFTNDMASYYLKCSACQEFNHDEQYCRIIHYTARHAKIIGKFSVGETITNRNIIPQQRQRLKQCTYLQLGNIYGKFLEYISNNIKELSSYEETYFKFSYFNVGINQMEGFESTSSDQNDEEDEEDHKDDSKMELQSPLELQNKKMMSNNSNQSIEADAKSIKLFNSTSLFKNAKYVSNNINNETKQDSPKSEINLQASTIQQSIIIKSNTENNNEVNIFKNKKEVKFPNLSNNEDTKNEKDGSDYMLDHQESKNTSPSKKLKQFPLINSYKGISNMSQLQQVPEKLSKVLIAQQFIYEMEKRNKNNYGISQNGKLKQQFLFGKTMKNTEGKLFGQQSSLQKSMKRISRIPQLFKTQIKLLKSNQQQEQQENTQLEQFEQQKLDEIEAWEASQLFDIFKGEFEKYCNFKNYFPKSNCNNVVRSMGGANRIAKQSKQQSGQIKENNFAYKKQKNKQKQQNMNSSNLSIKNLISNTLIHDNHNTQQSNFVFGANKNNNQNSMQVSLTENNNKNNNHLHEDKDNSPLNCIVMNLQNQSLFDSKKITQICSKDELKLSSHSFVQNISIQQRSLDDSQILVNHELSNYQYESTPQANEELPEQRNLPYNSKILNLPCFRGESQIQYELHDQNEY